MKLSAMLSKHRNVLMGFAAIWIVCFHANLKTNIFLIDAFFSSGDYGVDIFVFLSGFGLSYSLARNPDFYNYFRRRMKRLLPGFYFISLLALFLVKQDFASFIANLIPVQTWLGQSGRYWYISASIGFYLIVPPVYFLFRKAKYPFATCIATMLLFLFVVSAALKDVVEMRTFCRLPTLVTGIAYGILEQIDSEKKKPWKGFAMLTISAAISLSVFVAVNRLSLLPLGIPASDFALMSRGLLVGFALPLLSFVLELLEKIRLGKVLQLFAHLGKYSLEIYIGHLMVQYILTEWFSLSAPMLFILMLVTAYPAARFVDLGGKALLWCIKKIPVLKSE